MTACTLADCCSQLVAASCPLVGAVCDGTEMLHCQCGSDHAWKCTGGRFPDGGT